MCCDGFGSSFQTLITYLFSLYSMKRFRAAASSSEGAGPRGFQQQLAAAKAASTATSSTTGTGSTSTTGAGSTSVLADLLVDRWAWGGISTPLLQMIAHAAKTDFENAGVAPPRDLVSLATIGSSGSQPSHMHRDLVQHRLKTPPLAPAATNIKIWVKKITLQHRRNRTTHTPTPHPLWSTIPKRPY